MLRLTPFVKLLCEAGKACSDYQYKVFRKFSCGKSATINAVTASNPKAAFALIAQNYAVERPNLPEEVFSRVIGNGNHTSNRKIDNQKSQLAHTQCHVRPFIGANRTTSLRPHDSINGAIVVARSSQPALQLGNRRSIEIGRAHV